MFCTSCGAKNESDAEFCVNCGHPLEHGNKETDVSFQVQTADDTSSDGEVPEVLLDDVANQPRGQAGLAPGVKEPTAHETEKPQDQVLSFVVGQSSPTQNSLLAAPKKIQKKTIILWGSIIAVIALLAVAYMVLKSTVFSPSGQINSYVTAVSTGSLKEADKMVDPGVVNDSRVLLTDEYAKDASSRMKNIQIGSLTKEEKTKGYTVNVSYTVNGVKQSKTLAAEPAGKQFLVFDSWKITTPLVSRIKVAVPKTFDNVLINGIAVDLSKAGMNKKVVTPPSQSSSSSSDEAQYSSMNQYELPAYPGAVKVTLPESKYLKAEPAKLNTPSDVAYLSPQATDDLEKEILAKVQERINSCTASKEISKAGCDFSNGSFHDGGHPAYQDITRVVSQAPSLEKLDLSSGTFITETIRTDISYKYRYDGSDDWRNSTTSDSDTVSGSFSFKNDKLSVTINENSRSYY
ncbi:hypothetical protein KIM372_16590 [Bombiscardovia nodaiensis]|uniref:Zinc-ribbon domain-containing protein n=1 Tax=Bombiscardovia nodaiensis TaxID=2932181 RepID=A0ABN6SEQ2_9BIFI|nr:hypothetical protein KIM372_16590 [Bombiscardovia nodaiensis]